MKYFPHLGFSVSNRERGLFLSLMLQYLIKTLAGIRNIDDRDNISNKRIDSNWRFNWEFIFSIIQ